MTYWLTPSEWIAGATGAYEALALRVAVSVQEPDPDKRDWLPLLCSLWPVWLLFRAGKHLLERHRERQLPATNLASRVVRPPEDWTRT